MSSTPVEQPSRPLWYTLHQTVPLSHFMISSNHFSFNHLTPCQTLCSVNSPRTLEHWNETTSPTTDPYQAVITIIPRRCHIPLIPNPGKPSRMSNPSMTEISGTDPYSWYLSLISEDTNMFVHSQPEYSHQMLHQSTSLFAICSKWFLIAGHLHLNYKITIIRGKDFRHCQFFPVLF
ncbi:hypothetical protein OCU04_007023 [Sclerotinia nivalis]|uniref:Uncharacterized protein n=1 Tax=Sclerotinia nivalis TaxID=352851 RepID=A0A9X0ALV4_9HELO|nr:hypothetical protein OCU04_007023 [Sclerotinia nivalis]